MLRNICCIVAFSSLSLALSSVAQAAIALPDPGVVGPYRVLFTTSTSPSAADTNMPLLNTFVTGLAATSGLDAAAGSPGWSVLGATRAVDVYTNTGLADTGGVPIYLVDGTPFATDNADLWSLGAQFAAVNEDGVFDTSNGPGTWVHTGLDGSGSGSSPGLPRTAVGAELDTAAISHGGQDLGYNPWYGNGDTWAGGIDNGSLFAISGVIGGADGGGAPEPSSMVLLVLGGLGLIARRRRHRRA